MVSFLTEKDHEFFGIDKDNREQAENFLCDVILDFSSSACLKENLLLAERKKCSIVIGTTGHDDSNLRLINDTAQKLPVVLSSNFSLMFNIMLELIGLLKPLNACDFTIEEIHHRHKKDKPSGSCKMLVNELSKISIIPQVNCFRAGEIVGRHSLSIFGGNENMTISHEATSRKVFCEGALIACEFVLEKGAGLYTMHDVIMDKGT